MLVACFLFLNFLMFAQVQKTRGHASSVQSWPEVDPITVSLF